MIFYRISELILAILIQRYDKNHFISRTRDQQKFYRLSGATFHDYINTIYQFINLNLSWIIKRRFLRNMEPLTSSLVVKILNVLVSTIA